MDKQPNSKWTSVLELTDTKKHSCVFACRVSKPIREALAAVLTPEERAKLETARKFSIYIPNDVLEELGGPEKVKLTLEAQV